MTTPGRVSRVQCLSHRDSTIFPVASRYSLHLVTRACPPHRWLPPGLQELLAQLLYSIDYHTTIAPRLFASARQPTSAPRRAGARHTAPRGLPRAARAGASSATPAASPCAPHPPCAPPSPYASLHRCWTCASPAIPPPKPRALGASAAARARCKGAYRPTPRSTLEIRAGRSSTRAVG